MTRSSSTSSRWTSFGRASKTSGRSCSTAGTHCNSHSTTSRRTRLVYRRVLPVDLDQSLISEFQLFPREATPIQQSLLDLQRRLSKLPAMPEVAVLKKVLTECTGYVAPIRKLFENARKELVRMDAIVPMREQTMTEKEKERFRADRAGLKQRLTDLQKDKDRGFDVAVAKLKALAAGLNERTRKQTLRGLTAWVAAFLQIAERLTLVPAQARLELITVEPISLDPAGRISDGTRQPVGFHERPRGARRSLEAGSRSTPTPCSPFWTSRPAGISERLAIIH